MIVFQGGVRRLMFHIVMILTLSGCSRWGLRHSVDTYVVHEQGVIKSSEPATHIAPPPVSPPLNPVPVAAASPLAPHAPEPVGNTGTKRVPVVMRGEISYENATITEDVAWSGNVIVRGYLEIAPQATVRIEPGTVVRFIKSPLYRHPSRLIVEGRLHCAGGPDQPVRFISGSNGVGWGGILLLSSEKRNLLEHVRIDDAITAIEARFSNLTLNGVIITRGLPGMALFDSVARLTGVTFKECDTALTVNDSELDLRKSSIEHAQLGIVARRSALALQKVRVSGGRKSGVVAEGCRIRFESCEFAGNSDAARLLRSEGRIVDTRFVANRGVGLELLASSLKVHRSRFVDTAGDAIRLDDGRSVVWDCAFDGTSGYNLVNGGGENVSAVRNWWGSFREAAILDKILDNTKVPHRGTITYFPWLSERPAHLR